MAVETRPLNEALSRWDLPALGRNLFSSPQWMKVIDRTYHLQIFVKAVVREGRAESYVPYVVVRNFLEWKICVFSYCDYCDAHVVSLGDWKEIFASLRADYPDYRIAVRNLRDELVADIPELVLLSTENFHELDLSGGKDAVWRGASDSFRAAVSQAGRKGVVVRPCSRPELAQFYRLHLQVRKNKYKVFPQPFRFFDIIWEEFIAPGQGVLLGAFDSTGQMIGANMYLVCAGTLYYKFNTSAHHALKLRPNNALFWAGIEWALKRGLSSVDLGSSGEDQDGLILFKNQTGAAMRKIRHFGFTPPGYKYSQKKILRTFTAAMTQPWLPEAAVRWGSSVIYPYLA